MTVDESIHPLVAPTTGTAGGEARGRVRTGMRARAGVATELRAGPDGHERSCVTTLRSEAPLALRLARSKAPEPWAVHAADVARVCLTAGAGGPVGGDRLTLDIEVAQRSSLVLSEISPTLLLPGPHGERSVTDVRIRVATGATLIWLPEPMIAVRGCDHVNDVRVDLDDGARFLMREEILLGRHGEPTGRVRQRVVVRHAGRPLYRQDLGVGVLGADSPAVIGPHHAVGSMLVVDPSWADRPPRTQQLAGEAMLLPLSGPAVVVTAVAHDNLELREQLTAGLVALGPPWDPNIRPQR